jgi:hypothetical protein
VPTSCDAECAAVFLPLVNSCGNVLSQFLEPNAQQSLVAQCQASQSLVAGGTGGSYQCACARGWTGAHCEAPVPSSAVLLVTGAGTAVCNGFYKLDGSHNSKPHYCKISDCANYKIFYKLAWIGPVGHYIDGWSMAVDYYVASLASLPPTSGWSVNQFGTAPPPTLTWL